MIAYPELFKCAGLLNCGLPTTGDRMMEFVNFVATGKSGDFESDEFKEFTDRQYE